MEDVKQPEHVEQDAAPDVSAVGENNVKAEPEMVSKKNANLLIVVVLAVIVVILALMYLWGQTATQPQIDIADEPDMAQVDEVDAIEQDLVIPDMDTLGSELDELEAELDAELQSL